MATGEGCITKKEAEVQREIDQLHKYAENIADTIISLRERLKPVLRVIPSKNEEALKEPVSLVPLAEEIRQVSHKLSNCNGDIREIIETCEL